LQANAEVLQLFEADGLWLDSFLSMPLRELIFEIGE